MKASKGRGYSKYRGSHVERNRRAARPAAHEHRSNQEEKGFYLASSAFSLLFLGLIYAFSMFAGPMCQAYGLEKSAVALTFNIMMITFCIGAVYRRSNRKAYRTQDNAFRFRCSFLRWIRRNRHVCKWIDRVGLRFLRRPRMDSASASATTPSSRPPMSGFLIK